MYSAKEKDFNNNGLWVLDSCIKAEVKEEKNAEYSLELEYPIFGNEKWKDIIEENIIKVPTPKYGDQLFRIKNKRVDGTILYAYAIHIFYDLIDNFLEDVRPTELDGVGALNWILDGTQYPHNFKALSDITTVNTANYIRKNPVQALISDDDNSYLNRWGGELERDNYTVKMLQSAGTDRGTTIQFGKNLLEIEEDINSTEVTTRLMLTGLNEDDTVVTLPEKYIDSAYIQAYPQPKIRHYHYSDFKVDTANGVTLQNVYTMLRSEAQRLYKVEKIDIPKVNYKVNFVELSKTEEYKNYAILEKVYLNDTVTTKHSKIGIDIKAQVISYVWDAISSKYLEIELGNFRDNINKSFQSLNNALNKVSEELITNKSDLQKAIDNATQLMTNALGGYVLKRNGEILIMDTENPNTATKIWRWNINGLAYSKTGINGPYGLAMTMDGAIVADFITTGVLNAGLIKTGTLASADGSVSINMNNGDFKLGANGKSKVIINQDKLDINDSVGKKAISFTGRAMELYDYDTSTKIGEYGINSITPESGGDPKIKGLVIDMFNKSFVGFAGPNATGYTDKYHCIMNYGGYARDPIGMNLYTPLHLNSYNIMMKHGDIIFAGGSMKNVKEIDCQNLKVIYSVSAYHVEAESLNITGQKNRIVQTKDYGVRALNAVESADCFFIDKDVAETINGECKVYIKPIFKQTISLKGYMVDFSKHGRGDMWVDEIAEDYFVIKSDNDIKFTWTITAKQLGYEDERLRYVREDINIRE